MRNLFLAVIISTMAACSNTPTDNGTIHVGTYVSDPSLLRKWEVSVEYSIEKTQGELYSISTLGNGVVELESNPVFKSTIYCKHKDHCFYNVGGKRPEEPFLCFDENGGFSIDGMKFIRKK